MPHPSACVQGLDCPCILRLPCSSLKAATRVMVACEGRGGQAAGGAVLTACSSPVPRASHEVCIWRIPPLVPSGPLHGGLWEGKAGAVGTGVRSPLQSLLGMESSGFSESGAGDIGVDWELVPSVGVTF